MPIQEQGAVVALAHVFPQDNTSTATWGAGFATALHDALIETYSPDLDRIWLRVFEANPRARRLWGIEP